MGFNGSTAYYVCMELTVVKRNGEPQQFYFDKITTRLQTLGKMDPPLSISYTALTKRVIEKLQDRVATSFIDEIAAQECASSTDPDYQQLAGRIVVSNHHKNTESRLQLVTDRLRAHLREDYVATVMRHADKYEAMIDYARDYAIDYFGFKTLERAYLMKDTVVVERPQHMWMRVAIELHGDDLERVCETYGLMSQKFMTHATPTLFNAGTVRPQLSSCFLLGMKEDSIDGIYDTLKDCALISKWAGGIGLHVHNVRCKGSHIAGTNGTSNGLVPLLKVFNETARYVDQGGGKRNGSFAIYLGPEHPDIEAWLELKKNTGDENNRARDLFYGLWIPDLFMRRVKGDLPWSLMCPKLCPGLADAHGADYDALYHEYEAQGRATKTISARALWFKILDAQMETGTPSLLFKDACNGKSNQQNLGCIKSSNLCTEIIQYSDADETAVCNLASIALSAFVGSTGFNFYKLHQVTRIVTRNLNTIIDRTFYPTEEARRSNLLHRPIGIGVQGLADAFMLMDMPFYSEAAARLNRDIFETMYHAAVSESVVLAKETAPYSSFKGSPMSRGQFQFDLWGVAPSLYNWDALRKEVIAHGVRNSLLMAPMPTASTSQILGNNECFEPITSNIYTRRTLAGEFIMINKHLIRDLQACGKWSEELKTAMIANRGSVQSLDIPKEMKEKYRTVWEIPMKHIINMARDRGAFICQSQSMNLWLESPTYNQLTSMHFYAWEQGLKTGLYYLRRKPVYQTQQFTIEPCATCTA
jgi:ribonucleoside-diphosphate reductase alpha subunit